MILQGETENYTVKKMHSHMKKTLHAACGEKIFLYIGI